MKGFKIWLKINILWVISMVIIFKLLFFGVLKSLVLVLFGKRFIIYVGIYVIKYILKIMIYIKENFIFDCLFREDWCFCIWKVLNLILMYNVVIKMMFINVSKSKKWK